MDCQLAVLKRCLKVTLIRDTLKDLPRTLDDTYFRVFSSIDEVYREDAKNALMWLAFAGRPLQLTEIAEATVLRCYSNPPLDPEQRFPDPRDILEILSSLVTVTDSFMSSSDRWDKFDNLDLQATVTLAHYSVQEYLVSDRIKDSAVGYFSLTEVISNNDVSLSCLKYLLYHAALTQAPYATPNVNQWHYCNMLQHTGTLTSIYFRRTSNREN